MESWKTSFSIPPFSPRTRHTHFVVKLRLTHLRTLNAGYFFKVDHSFVHENTSPSLFHK